MTLGHSPVRERAPAATLLKVLARWSGACLAILCCATGHAEVVLDGYAGVSFPHNLSSIDCGSPKFICSSTIQLDTAPIVGARVSYFFERDKWFGIAAEGLHVSPNIDQQQVTVTTPSSATTYHTQQTHVDLYSGLLEAIARLPFWRVQPYVGAGVGLFHMSAGDSGLGAIHDTQMGLAFFAGAKVPVTERLALFVELKHLKTRWPMRVLTSDYESENVIGGLSWRLH